MSWMAGILYLYRLFVYHAAEKERVVRERFVFMERRLHTIIVHPAMGVSLILGLVMLSLHPELVKKPWMHGKLTMVVGMMLLSILAGRIRRELEAGVARFSDRNFRILNELPTLLMIGIVFLVILKPWN
jgi:putative membrane protein